MRLKSIWAQRLPTHSAQLCFKPLPPSCYHLRSQPLNLPNFNYKTHLITVSILRPAWQLPLPCSQSPAAVRDKWWSNGAVKREADQRANINGTQSRRPRSYNKQPKGEGGVMSCGALELPNGSLWPQHSHSNTPPSLSLFPYPCS